MATGDFFCDSRGMKPSLTLFATLMAIASVPVLAKVKPTLKFDETSAAVLVIVEVTPPSRVTELGLNLSSYQIETKEFTSNAFKGQTLLQAVKGQKGQVRYLAGLVKTAGTYIAHEMSTQFFWNACFDQGTRVFTFEPGKVYYLGSVDATEPMVRIVNELPHQTQRSLWVFGMGLPLTPPAQKSGWEQDVAAFLAEALPSVEAPVLAAEGFEVAFATGKGAFGGKICRPNL
jgi:hypothetical protein